MDELKKTPGAGDKIVVIVKTPSLKDMHLSPSGEKLIKGYEKCKLLAYRSLPTEPWTIGWGNTFYADGRPVKRGDTITRTEADKLFPAVISGMEAAVKKRITRNLTQWQFDALVCFQYNTGGGYFKGKKWIAYNIWANINAGMGGKDLWDYWTTLAITSSGVRLDGLIRRRKSEVTMFQTGELNFFEPVKK